MTRNTNSKARRFALAAVLGNLALIGLLASLLPQAALVLLPIIALTLPLLSAAAVEQALEPKPQTKRPARTATPRLTSALHQAA